MRNLINTVAAVLSLSLGALLIAGCSDATIASLNLEKSAEQFELQRRIVFFNGITDTYLLTMEGKCSIEVQRSQRQLEVTCKVGEGAFKQHHLGLSDNVSYFSEQVEAGAVSAYHYRVIFKPQTIVPDIDFKAKL